MIYVDHLSKYHHNKTVLQNITFHINKGERVGVFGPSGAGKTTLMRILAAYVSPSEGSVTIAGYDVFNHSLEVRKRIGYLPEQVSLYPDMTVCNYLEFVASLRKVKNRTEQISDTLAKVNLLAYATTRIGKLSKDTCRLVGLAQAIIHKPNVLILDDPTLGLNPRQIVAVQTIIKTLGDEYTLLIGTRTLSEAEQLCNRVLVLNKGRLVAEDTPAHLTARLAGAQRIRLQTLLAPADAACFLASLAGVNKVTPIGSGAFDIECDCDVDCRPAVANMVVQQGWGLLELHVVDASLEKVYLELTTNVVMTAA